MKKRVISLLICLLICLGMFSGLCFAADEVYSSIQNASVDQIAKTLDQTIDQYYNTAGKEITLLFPYNGSRYKSFEAFADNMESNNGANLRAVFKNSIVGSDYVTVNEYYMSKGSDYYYGLKVKISSNKNLRKTLDTLVGNAAKMDNYKKVQYFYNTLRSRIKYDISVAGDSGSERALLEGKAVCQGYARSFMELCKASSIPCLGVFSDTHMWNCVYVNGSWQMIDVTQGYFIGIDFSSLTDVDHRTDEKQLKWGKKYLTAKYGLKAEPLKIGDFTDLNEKWYRSAIEFCLERSLFTGITDTTFEPNSPMTRAMFVTVLGRMAGIKVNHKTATKFTDVKKGKWYTGYVKWASDKGIVNGVSQNKFAPDDNVTREQICKMMYEYCAGAGITLYQKNEKINFKDSAAISKWARGYVSVCQQAGLINGDKGYFHPQDNATRAEVATIFRNFCVKYAV